MPNSKKKRTNPRQMVKARQREPKASGYFLAFVQVRNSKGEVTQSTRIEKRIVRGQWVDVEPKGQLE